MSKIKEMGVPEVMEAIKSWETPMQITLFNQLKIFLEEKEKVAEQEHNSLKELKLNGK